MKSATENRVEAEAAVDALRERVLRLEEENGAALAAVEAASAGMTKALVDGRAPDEKRYELALEERDRAARRLLAAKEALARAGEVAALAGREDEAGRAAAALEADSIVAREARRDLKRAVLDLGRAARTMADCNVRSWQARNALQSLGGDGPIEAFPVPSLAFSALLDECAAELSAKRAGRTCDRLTAGFPY